MAEYIEREAAIDAIMKVYVRTAGYKARERVFEAEEAVHRLPAADVAPVVHGKWTITMRLVENAVCSNCGRYFQSYYEAYRYCPNCGAKMDKEEMN